MRLFTPLTTLASCLGVVCIHATAYAQNTPAPPVVGCSASPSSINAGDPVYLSAAVSSATGQPLNVSFASAAGSVSSNGNLGTLTTYSVPSGALEITCRATDKFGQSTAATTSVWVNSGSGEQALSAFSFIDSVGVNIHLHSGNSPYWYDFPKLYQSMKTLGVRHFRNGIDPYASAYELANAETLGVAGMKADWLIASACGGKCVNQVANVARHTLDAFEGPNEDDADSIPNVPAWMADLRNVIRGNPRTAGNAIYAPTPFNVNRVVAQGSLSPFVDAGSMHDYYGTRFPETPPYGGTVANCPQYGDLRFNICIANDMSPGRPAVSTETGYDTGVLSDVVIGKYLTRDLFNHLSAGVMRTYLYEFIDTNARRNGLVNANWAPKPAYTGIRNLLSMFSDATFMNPGRLDYSLTGQTDNVHHLLFQKLDGTFMMVLWLGVESGHPFPPNFDYNVPAQNVTVTTHTPVAGLSIASLDDNGNLYSVAPATQGSSTSVPVTDRITIVSFGPASSTVLAPRNSASLSNGWYELTNGSSDLCLDLSNQNTSNSSPILQSGCGETTQQWGFQPTDSGFYRIVNRSAPSQTFDVNDLGSANGSTLQVYSYWGGNNQQFMPIALGNGFYRLVARGSDRCLEIPGGSTAWGAQLQIWDCNGAPWQVFHLTPRP